VDGDLLIGIIERVGIFVFGLSGGLAAVRHRMDIVGVMIVALLPAVGGGTLRDLLLDLPVFWLDDNPSILLAAAGGLAAFFAPGYFARLKALVWLDAVGLALFAVVGADKAMDLHHGFLVTVMMGAMTAAAGGLIRDVVCNETPLLLREEVYFTAACLGASVYWGARTLGLGDWECLLAGAAAGLALRAAGIVFRLSLPKPRAGGE